MNEEDKQVTGVKAHQVSSLAASWALYSNDSMESILNACSWKSHNTFTQYYLKDMTTMSEKMLHLGPVVAAQHTSA
jgi:hypothetical protein